MGIVSAFMVPHPPLIIPQIGMGQERLIQDTIDAYEEVARELAKLKPDTIVVSSPHSVMYADYFHLSPGTKARGDFGRFRAGTVHMEVLYDTEFTGTLCRIAESLHLPAGTLGERERSLDHGTMVPLFFVNRRDLNYRLVRLGLSGLSYGDHYRLGQAVKQAAEELGRSVVFIASGDLSHRLTEEGPYGYAEEGPIYDRHIMKVMGEGNFLRLFDFPESFCERAGECGHKSFLILAGALDQTGVKARKLSYEGPFGVGYGICAYETTGPDLQRDYLKQYQESRRRKMKEERNSEDAYVSLARRALEEYICRRTVLEVPKGLQEDMMTRRAGTFVSLHRNGQLRGCIGTVGPTKESIAAEIIENAVSAGTRDPRFSPVREDELEEISYSVDVLGETELISSERQLDVKRYGVIVTKGGRRGLLLPNLYGVDTVEQQIAIAKQKAGIDREADDVILERFEVKRHG